MAHLDEEGQIVLDPEDFDSELNPYVKRFNDYRSEADRRATEYSETQRRLADLQSEDAEKQRAAAEALGLQFVDDVEDHEPPEALTALEQRIAAFEAKDAAREAAQKQAEEAATFQKAMDAYVAELGMKPDDQDTAIVIGYAANNLPFLENGLPNLEQARKDLEARDEQRFEDWKASKRRAPQIARGVGATEQKNIEDMGREERLAYVMAQHELD